MRNLGQFFGHIAQGIKADPPAGTPPVSSVAASAGAIEAGSSKPEAGPSKPEAGPSKVVRQQVQEAQVLTPDGPVVLRRTVIDEVRPGPE